MMHKAAERLESRQIIQYYLTEYFSVMHCSLHLYNYTEFRVRSGKHFSQSDNRI